MKSISNKKLSNEKFYRKHIPYNPALPIRNTPGFIHMDISAGRNEFEQIIINNIEEIRRKAATTVHASDHSPTMTVLPIISIVMSAAAILLTLTVLVLK